VYDQCVEAIQGYPLGYPLPTLLEALNRGSLGPSLPPTNNLKGCDTYKELVGSQAIPSIVSFPDDFSLSGGKIRLVICPFHFGPGAPEYWRIVLF